MSEAAAAPEYVGARIEGEIKVYAYRPPGDEPFAGDLSRLVTLGLRETFEDNEQFCKAVDAMARTLKEAVMR